MSDMIPAILSLFLVVSPARAAAPEPAGRPAKVLSREKAIDAALAAARPPAVPEEAKRRLARGEAAIEAAEDAEGYRRAAVEFEAACDAAPWLAAAYYNLAVAQEKAGEPAAAAQSLALYLRAAPGAKDAEAVRKKLYKLEFAAEQAAVRSVSLEGAAFTRLDASKHFRYSHRLSVVGDGLVYRRELLWFDRDLGKPLEAPEERLALKDGRFRWPNRSWCDNGYRCDAEGEISKDGRRIVVKYKPHPNLGEETEEVYDRQ